MEKCVDCGIGRATSSPILAFRALCFECIGKLKQRNRRISSQKRQRVFARDGYRCVICGCGEVDWLCIDHIHPVAEGGTRAMDNLQTLCVDCNELKGDSVMLERRRAAMEIDAPLEPDELSWELEGAHEAGGLDGYTSD